jgi:hypothetical protein
VFTVDVRLMVDTQLTNAMCWRWLAGTAITKNVRQLVLLVNGLVKTQNYFKQYYNSLASFRIDRNKGTFRIMALRLKRGSFMKYGVLLKSRQLRQIH